MFRCNHHHQGAHYMSLVKLQCYNSQLKHIGVVNLMVWLHMLSGLCWCVSAALFETTTNIYTNKYCKFTSNYSDMFRC